MALTNFLREHPSKYNNTNSLSCHRLQLIVTSILSRRMMLRLRDYGTRTVFGGIGLEVNTSVMAEANIPLRFINSGSDIEYPEAVHTR